MKTFIDLIIEGIVASVCDGYISIEEKDKIFKLLDELAEIPGLNETLNVVIRDE
jgi:hypothetical protein